MVEPNKQTGNLRYCKYEDYTTNPKSPISGLNCNWIHENILATMRPSSKKIKEFDIISQFQNNQITAILNLQENGEHSGCADGLAEQNGFSYLPNEFTDQGIQFYHNPWRDNTAPPFDVGLQAVKIIDEVVSIQKGKIAIHCHAGLGRTGISICCWLMYSKKLNNFQAMEKFAVRGGIAMNNQKEFLKCFNQFLEEVRKNYKDDEINIELLQKLASHKGEWKQQQQQNSKSKKQNKNQIEEGKKDNGQWSCCGSNIYSFYCQNNFIKK